MVVNQDVFLFAGTLGENIGLGRPRRGPGAHAGRRPGGWGPIAIIARGPARRGRGIDVDGAAAGGVVSERGANFSAGERQLIAFARALVAIPLLLILDEATASVDPEFERLIERGIAALMRGRTSIVIAHRLSTIRRADRIVVLDRGASWRRADTTSCSARTAPTPGCTACR